MLLREAKEILNKYGFILESEDENYTFSNMIKAAEGDEDLKDVEDAIISEILKAANMEDDEIANEFAPYIAHYIFDRINDHGIESDAWIRNEGKSLLKDAVMTYKSFIKYGEEKAMSTILATSDMDKIFRKTMPFTKSKIVERAKIRKDKKEETDYQERLKKWKDSEAAKHANDPGWDNNGRWKLTM